MEFWSSRMVVAASLAVAGVVALAAPRCADARELALAQGTIALHEAPAGMRAPACGELVVEARDGLDDHLIAQTRPEVGADGACRYALSVPAQSAVWIHARPVLVAAARSDAAGAPTGAGAVAPAAGRRIAGRGVQIRFTVIAPTTYFFAPGEQKTVPLTY